MPAPSVNKKLKYKRYPDIHSKLMDNISINGDCWELDATPASHGYCGITFRGKRDLAHRVSYRLFVGEIPEGLFILHKCDNRKCCRPDHLFAGTQLENVRDCLRKGRGNKIKKLSVNRVLEIKKLINSNKFTLQQIANDFGVCRPYISMIKSGLRRSGV